MANSKRLTIIAGVNGAGKTTFYYASKNKYYGERICSDDILRENNGDWNNISDQVKYGMEALKLQEKMFEEGKSFSRETTLCGMEMLNTIKQAKARGYYVHMIYIGIDTAELAKQRVEHRVELGGHGVPSDVIDRRLTASLSNLIETYKFCDLVNIFDNSGKKFNNIANIIDGKLFVLDKKCKWGQQVISQLKEDMEKQELTFGF